MPEQITPSIFSQDLKTKGNNYFFDIKKAVNGSLYLVISETRIKKDGQKFRGVVTVFQNNLKEFLEVLEKVVEQIK